MTTPRALYKRFREIHPRSLEPYNPTPANVRRWAWHIRQAGTHPKYTRYVPEKCKDFEELVKIRRVRSFDDLEVFDKLIFQRIANCFTGPVYACGSRVRGDYIEITDPPEVAEWRKRAGKPPKEVSDYDFWTPADSFQVCEELPKNADRLRHGVDDKEKILIPKSMEGWDFSKLPEHEHGRVIELYKAGRWADLAAIHDKYNLSNYSYCCDLSGLKVWYKFGIEQGKIKSNG
jgi:hypothetical protein